LRILITNAHLSTYSGGETYVRDLALALFRRGHTPIVHTRERGPLFDEIGRRSIPTITALGQLADPPDVIAGMTQEETVLALLHFRGTPAVFVCHARQAWLALAPRLTRIRRYVAVDENCRDGLVCEQGIPAARVQVLLNAVDVERFTRRGPLPPRPARAVVFSNYAQPGGYAETVRRACVQAGVEVDVIGAGYGRSLPSPEAALGQYDLVFAKARCAQEAVATGCAVVLCDQTGLGPLVSGANVAGAWRANLGWRLLQQPITVENVTARLREYDGQGAAAATDWARTHATLDRLVTDWITLLEQVVGEHRASAAPDPGQELDEVAGYLGQVALHGTYRQLHLRVAKAEAEAAELRTAQRDLVVKAEEQTAQLRAVQRGILESRSWRLTAPLRRLSARLRPRP
jgi:hypothetical protein